MKNRILLITIGGSCEPIVTAIRNIKPKFVYFICSSDNKGTNGEKINGSYVSVVGNGMVCGRFPNLDKPNIITQCDLQKDKFEVVKLRDCDDYNSCYLECVDLIHTTTSKYPDSEIIIDYTGGTKSMSGGILLAAADFHEVIVSVVKGTRFDLIKVKDGTERVVRTRINIPLLQKKIQSVHELIEKYEYQGAITLIEELFLTPDLNKKFERELFILHNFCKCFNYWDKFDHQSAKNIAKSSSFITKPYLQQLELVINLRRRMEEGKPIPITKAFSGYEVVLDLIKNAERKAIQKKYDDATGRLYRSTELLAQVRLKMEKHIETVKVPVGIFNEEDRKRYENSADNNGNVKIGLFESYKLLASFNDPVFTPIFERESKKIMKGLEIRNSSILAHGFIAVDGERYKIIYESLIANLVQPILVSILGESFSTFKQLPNHAPQPL